MKPLSENFGPRLAFQSAPAGGKPQDFAGLWEEWSQEGPAVFLESAGPLSEAGEWLILAGKPHAEFFGKDGKDWWKDSQGLRPASFHFFDFLDGIGRDQAGFETLPACLSTAWFGVLSYDFGKSLNPGKTHSWNGDHPGTNPVPDFYFFKPTQLTAHNRRTKETFFFGREPYPFLNPGHTARVPFKVHNLRGLSNSSQYESRVLRAKDYIAQGDIYQANLAQVFQADWEGNAGTLYRMLREMNPGPFMGIFQGEGFTVVSSSPERLVAGRGDWLETRPIAGTRPRGRDDQEDLRMKVELKTNPKEQAEHLMLVDLARNDMGRVSRFGTVEVERYAEVESYARVQHLVSTVRSQKNPSASFSQVLRSLFPGGTITGCPKIRCMEIIEELEGRPRGFYTGSMGYLGPGPCFDFNILIRSFTLFHNGTLEFQAGAGIVADSDPKREYMETLYKVEALAQALGASLLRNP